MTDEPPAGWLTTSVGAVAKYVRGVTYQKEHARNQPEEGLLPVLRANNIGAGLNFEDLVYVPSRFVSNEQLLRDGDIVFAMSSGSKSVVGKAAKATRPPSAGFGAFCGVLRPRPEVHPSLLGYYFQTKTYRNRVSELSKGVNINNLKAEHLLDLPLQLPPAAEQQRIVSRVEELFSEIDEGERALERVGQLVERYRQSVLKAAVTGELTRGESSAGELPKGWQLRSLPELSAEKSTNGISVKGSDSPPGVAALRLDAITETGFDFTARRFIPISADKAEKLAIRAGDFFVSRANGSLQLVGRGVLASEPPCQTVFPDTMIRYRLGRSEALNRWVALAWSSGFVRRQIEARAKTTAGIYKISQGDISEIVFPVPPTEAEMLQVADAVGRQSGAWRRVLAEQRDRAREATALRQSILKAAFSGQLVPQDPADEPASSLLARLAAQAADAPATPRRRGRPAGRRLSQPNPEAAD